MPKILRRPPRRLIRLPHVHLGEHTETKRKRTIPSGDTQNHEDRFRPRIAMIDGSDSPKGIYSSERAVLSSSRRAAHSAPRAIALVGCDGV